MLVQVNRPARTLTPRPQRYDGDQTAAIKGSPSPGLPPVSDHSSTPAHMLQENQRQSVRAQRSGLRDRAVSPNPFSPNLVCVCVSELGLAVVWVCGTTRTVGFLERRGKVVPFFIVSCLSFTALTQHKGCGSAQSDSCAVPWSGADLSQNTDKKKKEKKRTTQFGLDESLSPGRK